MKKRIIGRLLALIIGLLIGFIVGRTIQMFLNLPEPERCEMEFDKQYQTDTVTN
jgi:hypothetical protein